MFSCIVYNFYCDHNVRLIDDHRRGLLDFIEIDICHRYLGCTNGQSTETSKLSLNPIRSGSCHLSESHQACILVLCMKPAS